MKRIIDHIISFFIWIIIIAVILLTVVAILAGAAFTIVSLPLLAIIAFAMKIYKTRYE